MLGKLFGNLTTQYDSRCDASECYTDNMYNNKNCNCCILAMTLVGLAGFICKR